MTQRIAAAMLIVSQALTIAHMSHMTVFPIAVAIIAFVGALAPLQFELSRRTVIYLLLAVGLGFVVNYLVLPPAIPRRSLSIGSGQTYTFGQFLIAAQLLQLFVRRPDGRLPSWLTAAAAACMICAANVAPMRREREIFLWLTLGFLVAATFYIAASTRPLASTFRRQLSMRGLLAVGTLVGGLVIGGGSATLLYRYQRELEGLFLRLAGSPGSMVSVGFSGKAQLSSVTEFRQTGASKVALRVVAEDPPAYLRGAAFDTLVGSGWRSTVSARLMTTADSPPAAGLSGRSYPHWFTLRKTDSTAWRRFDVWNDPALSDTVFAPMGTTIVQASFSSATLNEHEIFQVLSPAPDPGYCAFLPQGNPQLAVSAAYLNLLTKPPRNLHPGVINLAASLCPPDMSTSDKIKVVENYFQDNYQYRAGIEIPAGEDPLTYFLRERPPAHCEYFAAGAAVLLRQSGVPCRYVTGFVVTERNSFSGEWIARNKDAHAWVEAWDEEHGWTIVEATPHDGVPVPLEASSPRHLWEYIRDHVRSLWSKLRHGNLRAAALMLIETLLSPVALTLAAIVAALFAIRLTIRNLRSRPQTIHDPRFAELSQLLARMDRHLRPRKLSRGQGETLHQFAARISQAAPSDDSLTAIADWYRNYAALRYANKTDGPQVTKLRDQLSALKATPQKRVKTAN